MNLKILGVGLPRTGTQSLADALEMLGYRTLHAHNGIVATDALHDLPEFEAGQYRPFDGYDAGIVDEYWLWLLEAYPEAKVILTVRDPLAWFRSIAAHIDEIHGRRTERDWLEIEAADRLHERILGSRWPLKTLYLHRFEAHALAVKAACHEMDRPLLVYDLTVWPRWDALCRFLGHEVPDAKFPWRHRLASR